MSKKDQYVEHFNGKDYSDWKFKFEVLLDSKDLLHVINKRIPSHPDRQWERDNKDARYYIVKYLDS